MCIVLPRIVLRAAAAHRVSGRALSRSWSLSLPVSLSLSFSLDRLCLSSGCANFIKGGFYKGCWSASCHRPGRRNLSLVGIVKYFSCGQEEYAPAAAAGICWRSLGVRNDLQPAQEKATKGAKPVWVGDCRWGQSWQTGLPPYDVPGKQVKTNNPHCCLLWIMGQTKVHVVLHIV